jgi:type I restriction enzyme, S subunit
MRSNYKRLGDYIVEINVKNNNDNISNLLGVSNNKYFMPSIANTNGTDLSKYKVVRQGQFAFGPVTSRNGDKISIALMKEDEAIVSTSYTTFKIINHDELLPEYLILWFKRPEFDRYARFMSHGSVREIFDWDMMCNVKLPIPNILIQQKFVDNYERIISNFQNKNLLQEKLDLLGLNFVELLTDDNTETVEIKSLVNVVTGKKNAEIAIADGKYAFFTCSKEVYYTKNYSFEGNAVLVAGNGAFDVKYYSGKFEAYQRTYVLIPQNQKIVGLLYFYVKNKLSEITKGNRGSVIDFIVKSMIEDFEIKIPKTEQSDDIKKLFNSLVKYIDILFKSNRVLNKLSELYISTIVTIEV